jgi:hypothetical protein
LDFGLVYECILGILQGYQMKIQETISPHWHQTFQGME